MKEIQLTRGMKALIDDDDLEKISGYKWRAQKGRNAYYATANIGDYKEGRVIQMQNLIIAGIPEGMMVDHADRNGLNNQRSNLRICTRAQNGANRTPWGKSQYLGVSKKKGRDRWRAFIGVNGTNLYIGTYKTEVEAALAYNMAVKKHKGEFANLNKIEGSG